MSLVEPYSEQFVLKSRNIPTVSDLFNPSYLNLTYPELLQKCGEIDITLNDADRSLIELDTRSQANGTAFFRHRAGRIGASQSFAVAHTNSAMPSQSLIKSICYPQLFKFTSKATDYGCQNEGAAVNAYANAMSQKQRFYSCTFWFIS